MLGSFIQKSRLGSQKRGENASTQERARWDEASIPRKLAGDLESVTPEKSSEGRLVITTLQRWNQGPGEGKGLGPGPTQVETVSGPALSGPELSAARGASRRTRTGVGRALRPPAAIA